jgi:DNA repair protein RadC
MADNDKDPREGHRGRLREKFLKHGLEKFTDEEIIELLLTVATPRRDCKQPAREVLTRFKTFRNVMEADIESLTEIKGIGKTNAFGIKFIHQVARKFLRERMLEGRALHSSDDAFDYLDHSLRGLGHEEFRIIYLNASDMIVDEEAIAVGTATEVPVTPQQIVERAVKHGAVKIMLAHNHPGGTATPSEEDKEITREVVFVCGMMKLRLLEHIIIAPNDHFSFSKEGMIAEYEEQFNKARKKNLG